MSTFKQPTRVAYYADTYTHGIVHLSERVCKRPESTRDWEDALDRVFDDPDVCYVGWKVID
jgi:hypothetical protein